MVDLFAVVTCGSLPPTFTINRCRILRQARDKIQQKLIDQTVNEVLIFCCDAQHQTQQRRRRNQLDVRVLTQLKEQQCYYKPTVTHAASELSFYELQS